MPVHMPTPRHFAYAQRFYGTQKLMLLLTLKRFAEAQRFCGTQKLMLLLTLKRFAEAQRFCVIKIYLYSY
jgi:hypothetical protein